MQHIAGIDRDAFAPEAPYGRASAPFGIVVFDIVMNKRVIVDQLECNTQRYCRRGRARDCFMDEQRQRGAELFTGAPADRLERLVQPTKKIACDIGYLRVDLPQGHFERGIDLWAETLQYLFGAHVHVFQSLWIASFQLSALHGVGSATKEPPASRLLFLPSMLSSRVDLC